MDREFWLPLVGILSAVGIGVAVLIVCISSYTAARRDEFRARCVESGGEPLETLTGGGSIAITCRPAGYQGDITIVEERSTVVPMPVVVRH